MKIKYLVPVLFGLLLAGGCEDDKDEKPLGPVADFSTEKENIFLGETVYFVNDSYFPGGEIIAYAWDFGTTDSDNTSTRMAPMKVFAEPGSYEVTLTVTGDNGASDTVTKTIEILDDGIEVIANFTTEKERYLLVETVEFTNTTTVRKGNISAYAWDFGESDQSVSADESPRWRYSSEGEYKVTLEVWTDRGEYSSAQKYITILNDNVDPVAGFSVPFRIAYTREQIAFTDLSVDEDGDIVSWAWDFGDGNTSAQQNPTHEFRNPGTFEVTLTVTDDVGATDRFSVELKVVAAPEFKVLWTKSINMNAQLRGVVASVGTNGDVYVVSDGQELQCYSSSGNKKWTFDLSKDGIAGQQQKSSVTVGEDGTLYVMAGATTGYCYAIDQNGNELWKYHIGTGITLDYTSPAIHANGNILVGHRGSGGSIRMIDKNTGTEVWSSPTSSGGPTGMIACDGRGYIYYALSGGNGYGVMEADGTEVDVKLGEGYSTSGGTISIDDGYNTYLGLQSGSTGFNLSYDAGFNTRWNYSPPNAGNSNFSGPVIGPEGEIYSSFNTANGMIIRLTPDGSLVWSYMESAGFGGTPAVDCYGNIHCGDNAGYYHVVRPDGRLLFKEQVGTNIWSSPVIADDGKIYLNCRNGSEAILLSIDMGLEGPADSPWPQRARSARHDALRK